MRGFDAIVEGKIAEAQRAGAFDDLPGAGKPLDLDDDRLVPEDVRAAYRILKNAGFVPAELLERQGGRRTCASSWPRPGTTPERQRLLAKLALLEARIEASRAGSGSAAGRNYGRATAASLRARRMPGIGLLSLNSR